MSTELALLDQRVIATPADYTKLLAELASKVNLLTPFTSIAGIAPSHLIRVHTTLLDLDPFKGGDVYGGFLEDGRKGMPFLKGTRGGADEEFAIAKGGLRKLADLASMSTGARRTDNGVVRNYWSFEGYVTYTALNGTKITKTATAEWDLRDGSDRMKGWVPNQVSESRKNGLRNAETRAINAAIREAGIGIKQKYTRAELQRPFVVIEVAYQPDMSDPLVKEIVTRHALGGHELLYGGGGRALPPVEDVEPAEEPRSVGRGTTSQTTPPVPAADEPPTPEAVKIKAAEKKSFVYQNGQKKGQQGERYLIIDSTGTEYSTFSKTHYDDAVRFKAENAWVEIATEGGQYNNIIEIVKAGSAPNLPGLDGL